jgi:hypothetical protein
MQRLRDKYPDSNGWMPWVDKTAEYADFCGAISPEGEIIYRLPVKQHFPDTVYQVWQTNTAGTSIYLKVGSVYTKTVVDDGNLVDATPGEKIQVWGKCRQNLIYTFPDKLESFGPNDLDKFKNAMKAAGYTAFHSKCSARE